MAHLGGLVEHLSFRKVGQRVALALLENTTQDGDMVRLTQAGLAAEVGTTREVVARCLAGLQRAGAIRLGRGRITVLHRDQVAKETLD
jgi:CRP/FNR family transcriptional regulator